MSQLAPVPRILLVEDDAAIREALDEVLGDLGYEVVSAPDGSGGLRLAAEQSEPCPILLDWRMPVLDGPEFLARLRELPRGRVVDGIGIAGEVARAEGGRRNVFDARRGGSRAPQPLIVGEEERFVCERSPFVVE